MSSSDRVDNQADRAGLYVHVPFCARVCPYCDFAVLVDGPRRRERFVRALLLEIERVEFEDLDFDTVYFGGGTPSLLAERELTALLEALHRRFRLRDPWITLEANPEDVSPAAARTWRALGVRTLSLGVQSFDDAELRFLGRAHDAAAATGAVRTALSAGFDAISVDLIYGLPGQTAMAWERNFETLLALAPQHASCYQLTVHSGTRFGKQQALGRLAEMPADGQAELFLSTHDRFATAGWDAYEVSNFAVEPRYRSLHNRKYWRHAPYLGLGPSAHSYDGVRRRWWNHRRLADWAMAVEAGDGGIEAVEELTAMQWALEAVLFGLRTSDGLDLAAIRRRTGLDLLAPNRDRLQRLAADGLLIVESDRWIPSRRGMALAEWMAVQIEVPSIP